MNGLTLGEVLAIVNLIALLGGAFYLVGGFGPRLDNLTKAVDRFTALFDEMQKEHASLARVVYEMRGARDAAGE